MKDKVRIDKWLWSVRIFKSRTISTDACKSGKVKINGANAKPSATVEVNNTVEVRKNGFNLKFKVVKLIEKRVSATLAAECLEDLTSMEELQKYEAWYVGKAQPELRDKGAGRPTKRERREIDRFKIDYLWMEEDGED